jgi:ATP-binding cassette, subfamily B, bacterial
MSIAYELPDSHFPIAEDARHPGAKAAIDPDVGKTWLRRAMPIVLSHRAMFASFLVTTVAALLVQITTPRLLMAAIDNALVGRTVSNAAGASIHVHSSLRPFVFALLALAVARGVLNYLSRYYMFRTAYGIEYDFRTIAYEHFSRLPFSFYDRVQSGQLISRANSDIRAVQMYLTFAPLIIVQCLSAVLALAIMLTINVPLALVAMATMPFVYFVGVKLRERMFPVSYLTQARLAEVSTIVDESIGGVRVVKSFAGETRQVAMLHRAARRVAWAFVRDMDIRARWAPVVENLPRLGLAFVLLYGGYLVYHGDVQVGAIVAVNIYVLQLQQPFRLLGALMMLGQRARASAGRIYEILDEPVAIADAPDAVDLGRCTGRVGFDRVSFRYGDGPLVLRDLDLELRPGECVALVGRTGSGKSTVARLVGRFYDVTEGAIRIDGHDVRELSLGSLRKNVGLVIDEPFLFSVSIHDNIAYGRPTATRDEVIAAAKAASAHDFVTELEDGYDTVVGERGYTLSGGQRQRIAIARTLLVDPPILVLDDATSSVDVRVEETIHGALRTLMRGRTTLIIAHRQSTISLADRVVLLEAGEIVADGDHAELMATEPRYAAILARVEDETAQSEAEQPW